MRRARATIRTLAVRVLVAAAALAAVTGPASAHELGAGKFAAPVPLSLLFLGAGATVAATAVWLGVGDPDVLDVDPRTVGRVSPRVARALEAVLRVGALALLLAALAHGLVGRQVPAENLATVVVWPLFVKGVGIVAVLAGSPWRVLSPWETLYGLLARLEGEELAVVGDYPDWLGAWPAVAGFVLGVGILENLTLVPRSPTATVAVAAGYAVVMLAGGVAFGREWFARADALAVLFDLLGRVSVVDVRREAGGATLAVRPPWTGVTAPLADTSLVAFVVAAVYTVSFDGFTATQVAQNVLDSLRSLVGAGAASLTLYAVGLVVFLGSFLAAAALVDRLGRSEREQDGRSGPDWSGTARAFGGTVVPIAAAYEVAHNYPFVAANLGQAVTVLRHALDGDAGAVVLLGWLSVSAFWVSQVVLIVGGHLVAVVAAHRVAVERYDSPAAARRGHAPLVVVMVGYTVLSLWIVSQPVVG